MLSGLEMDQLAKIKVIGVGGGLCCPSHRPGTLRKNCRSLK